MQRDVRLPRLGAEVVDLVHLDADGEVVGLEELDRPAAVVQIRLHHQRVVVRLAFQLIRQSVPGLVRHLEVAAAGRDGQVDLAARRRRRFLALPFVEHGLGERLVVQRLGPGDAFDVMAQDVAVLAHELPRGGHGLQGDVVDEAGESHAEMPRAAGFLRRVCIGAIGGVRIVVSQLVLDPAQDDQQLVGASVRGELRRSLPALRGQAQLQRLPLDDVDAFFGYVSSFRGRIDLARLFAGIELKCSFFNATVRQCENFLPSVRTSSASSSPGTGVPANSTETIFHRPSIVAASSAAAVPTSAASRIIAIVIRCE